MLSTWVLIVGSIFAQQTPTDFKPGDKVVVIRPSTMQAITGSPVPQPAGATLVVRSAKPGQLTVAAGREGTVPSADVIAADTADAHFSGLIAANASNAAALRARGRLRFDDAVLDPEKLDRAIADFERSLELEPTSEAYTFSGFAWKRKGDKDRAMADFDRAIELNPREALAWRVRGATWASKGDLQKALAEYSESIRIDPDNPDSLHHRVVMQSACMDPQIRNAKQALADATRACEVSNWKDPLYMFGLAMAYAESGDFASAIKWQSQAMSLSGGDRGQTQLDLYRQNKPNRTTWR